MKTTRELLAALDDSMAKAKQALRKTTDEHLLTPWRLLYRGTLMSEQPRHVALRDASQPPRPSPRPAHGLSSPERQPVPAIYGPSADEGK